MEHTHALIGSPKVDEAHSGADFVNTEVIDVILEDLHLDLGSLSLLGRIEADDVLSKTSRLEVQIRTKPFALMKLIRTFKTPSRKHNLKMPLRLQKDSEGMLKKQKLLHWKDLKVNSIFLNYYLDTFMH